MTERSAWGIGLATVTAEGQTLDTWFPNPQLGAPQAQDEGPYATPADLASLETDDPARPTNKQVVQVTIDLDGQAQSTPDAYLRLHLLSHRLVAPNTINLDGIFAVLPNVVWTSAGPLPVEDFEATRLKVLAAHPGVPVNVLGVDKFPRMTDYVIPSGVRIADADRVRLGAHLASGTTVMHEGFINFNAGTLGNSMVEGRISQGVVVGDGSDVGGGSSIMGTLSGGGTQRVSIGQRCLLGANAGLGISLGDDCVVEAGLYLTAGTKVTVAATGEVIKAVDLSGQNGLLFRRNSTNGVVEVLPRSGDGIALNEALHASQ